MNILNNKHTSESYTNQLISNTTWAVLLVLEGLLIGYYLFQVQAFHYDEFESIHAGWKISVGEQIYKDFYELHHPLLYYLLALIIKIFGETLISLYISNVIITIFAAGIIFYTYKLSKLIFNTDTAIISTILLPLVPWFTLPAFEIRPDVPMLFFGIASIYYLYCYFNNKNNFLLIISALFLGISFLFLQKAIFLYAFIGSLLIYRAIIKDIQVKVLIIYAAIILITYVLFLISISIYSDIPSYFFFSFNFIGERAEHITDKDKLMLIYNELRNIDRLAWIIVPSFLLGIKFCRLSKQQKEITAGGLWLLLTVFFSFVPYPQYYLPSMVLIIIIVSFGIVHLLENYNTKIKNIILSCLVIAGSINVCYSSNYDKLNRDLQINQINHVLSKTVSTDYIYDGCNIFNLYRKDLDFFWFLGISNELSVPVHTTYSKLKPYDYDIYNLIDKKKPKFISPCFINLKKYPWILRRYRQTSEFEYLYIKYNNKTGFNFWHTFVDDLGTGSSISPAWGFFTVDGYIKVKMIKAADTSTAGSQVNYPYVGIGMDFDNSIKTVDLTNTENIVLTYKVSAPIDIILKQEESIDGEEYRLILPPTDEFTEITLDWSDFYQPSWSKNNSKLDLKNITGIKFQITSPEEVSVDLEIRNIKFTSINL